MLAAPLARALAARGIHYGWVIVGFSFFYLLFSTSALGVPGVLILSMTSDLGLSIGDLSAPQGLRLALFGLVAPFAGGLMLRFGPRRLLIVGAVLVLAGLLLAATSVSRWQVWLGVGVILGIAPGLTALQLQAIVSSRWFSARRGLVLGLMSGATATGVLIFMPLATWIAAEWGWRAAFAPSGIGVAVMLLVCLLLFRDRPQELGLPSYGEAVMMPVPPAPTQNFVRISLDMLREGGGRPIFWVLTGAFGVCGISSFGITQVHFLPFCGDIGIPAITAASLLAIIGVADLIGTIASGWLSDRYDNRWLLAAYYGFRGLSLIWLVSTNTSIAGLSVFAVVYGLDFIATLPPTVKLTVGAFGREKGPAMVGWMLAAHQLCAGLFATIAGISRDAIGSYIPSFLAAGILCLIAAASFSFVKRSGARAAPVAQAGRAD
jgi:predicted MFS family arabinose efflux permease